MSVKLHLRKTHKKKDGTYPIIIQVIADRSVKIISTGYSVKDSQFREGLEKWVVKHPDAAFINEALEIKRAEIAKTVIQAQIKGERYDTSKSIDTVFKSINALLTQYEARNQVAGHTRLTTNLSFLKEAWGRDVPLTNLNKEWVNKYVNYRFKKGNTESTIQKNLKDLAVTLNVLEDYEGKNYWALAAETITVKPVRRESLTAKEIKALEKVKLEGLTDLARDIFLFAFYCHGMRFESVVLLTRAEIKGGFIRYRMNKGKKIREVAIHDKLKAIIDKYAGEGQYLFPVIKRVVTPWTKKNVIGPANTMLRAYLDRAAILAGIDKHIHYHLAKHSFAALGIMKGVSYSIMKDALGHTNFSTTQQYLNSLTDIRINDAIKQSGLFD